MSTTRAASLRSHTRFSFGHRGWWSAWLLLASLGLPAVLFAQEPKPKAAAKDAATAKDEAEEIPEPVELKGNDLRTIDGVVLKATYYPSNLGKKAVPVVLLHSFKGDRKEFGSLGLYLQKQGFAVIAPDLRGHGESTERVTGTYTEKIEAARLSPDDYVKMYAKDGDLDTIRAFLVKENDDEKLNLNALGLVGSEMGASVAVYFAGYNNCFLPRVEPPDLRRVPRPDVKALVLLSPPQSSPPTLSIIKGLSTYLPLKSVMPMLILVGEGDSRTLADANRIVRMVKPLHRTDTQDPDFFFGKFATKLQGSKLISVKGPDADNAVKAISTFLQRRLVNQDFPWSRRTKD